MTDKQIIDLTEIDKKYKDKCSLIKAGKCKNVNIFIEQSRKLKAKEQECEELKDDKIYLQDRVGKLERVILRKNDELDQLKKENDLYKQSHKTEQDRRRAFEQTLEEIREIAEEKKKVGDWLALEILQKINEVIDD